MPDSLSPAAARRVLLAAQGFGSRPTTVGTRQLNLLLARLRLLQLDSVNVYERSHYLPAAARLGAYDTALLDRLTFGRRSAYTEQWAHEAAIVPVDDWPLFAWRRQAFRDKHAQYFSDEAATLDWLRAELAAKGPLTSAEVEHADNVRQGPWWGWSSTKRGLESLFRAGELVVAGRTRFQRRYALAEAVLPPEIGTREVSRVDALRELVRRSSVALGIGTIGDLADYYRLRVDDTKAAVLELVEAGELREVRVDGWTQRAYLHRDVRIPRRVEATALLSPFDPVVWDRDRALRMFGFHYRIEIYTPAPQRVYGYYTLPVLVDDAVPARVDLKSDRQRGVLRVQSAWSEAGAPPATVERVALAVREASGWRGLPDIEVADRGDLAPALAAELGVRPIPV